MPHPSHMTVISGFSTTTLRSHKNGDYSLVLPLLWPMLRQFFEDQKDSKRANEVACKVSLDDHIAFRRLMGINKGVLL